MYKMHKLTWFNFVQPYHLTAWLNHVILKASKGNTPNKKIKAGRAAGVNPRKMQWATLPGVVYQVGDFERCRIERYKPAEAAPIMAGVDFEDLILARQEKYIDG